MLGVHLQLIIKHKANRMLQVVSPVDSTASSPNNRCHFEKSLSYRNALWRPASGWETAEGWRLELES